MPADEVLLNRVRELLEDVPDVDEKRMFGGVAFLVDGKMCVNVSGDELMCRIGPDAYDEAIEQPGTRALLMGGKEYRGYIRVEPEVLLTKAELAHWVNLCLAYNPQAEASKKKKPGEGVSPDQVLRRSRLTASLPPLRNLPSCCGRCRNRALLQRAECDA